MDTVDTEKQASLTIDEFCRLEKISRSTYYAIRKNGQGPREMVLNSAKRISPEAHLEWRRAREGAAA